MGKHSTPSSSAASRDSINLRTIQRIDPSIVTVLESASYVVLYTYVGGKWAKEGVEGSLFVFRRSLDPIYGFLILNRNGMNNFIRPITSTTDLDVQDQFIHTSGEGMTGQESVNTEAVHGLWFHAGATEAERIVAKMQELRSESTGSQPVGKDPSILSMTDLLGKLSAGPSTSSNVPSFTPSSHSTAQSVLPAIGSARPSEPFASGTLHSSPSTSNLAPTAQNLQPPPQPYASKSEAASSALKAMLGLTPDSPSANSTPTEAHRGLVDADRSIARSALPRAQPSPLDRLFLAGGPSASPSAGRLALPSMPAIATSVSSVPESTTSKNGTPPHIHAQPALHLQDQTMTPHRNQQAHPPPNLNGSHQSYATPPHMVQVGPSSGFQSFAIGSLPGPAHHHPVMYPVQTPPLFAQGHLVGQSQTADFPPLGSLTPGQGHPGPRPFPPPHPESHSFAQQPDSQGIPSPIPKHINVNGHPRQQHQHQPVQPPHTQPQSTPTRGGLRQTQTHHLLGRAPFPPVPTPEPTASTALFPFLPAVLSTKSPTPKKTGLVGENIRSHNLATGLSAKIVIDKEEVRRILHQKIGFSTRDGFAESESGRIGNGSEHGGEVFRSVVKEIWMEDEAALCGALWAAMKAG